MAQTRLQIPTDLDVPWLTWSYVTQNAFYPVPKIRSATQETCFGRVACATRDEIRAGDIIIFNEFDEWSLEGKYDTDRFHRITEDEIEAYLRGEKDLLPNGVVVHPPVSEPAD